jgi:hypothetical protein
MIGEDSWTMEQDLQMHGECVISKIWVERMLHRLHQQRELIPDRAWFTAICPMTKGSLMNDRK